MISWARLAPGPSCDQEVNAAAAASRAAVATYYATHGVFGGGRCCAGGYRAIQRILAFENCAVAGRAWLAADKHVLVNHFFFLVHLESDGVDQVGKSCSFPGVVGDERLALHGRWCCSEVANNSQHLVLLQGRGDAGA